MNYYISDIHFGNEALLIPQDGNETRKGTRPFPSVEEMNEKIIENINDCCTDEDILYIIGDIAQFYNVEESIELLKRLAPKLVLVMGNHDKSMIAALRAKDLEAAFKSLFERIVSGDSLLIRDGKYDLFLSHYPVIEWDGYYKGRYLFYGHVHSGKQGPAQLMQYVPTAINVGVDVNDFRPKTAEELIKERKESYRVPEWNREYIISKVVIPDVDLLRADKHLDLSDFDIN